MTETPFYDELVARYGVPIPDPLDVDPVPALPDVPPRVDDWCEDRPPVELGHTSGGERL